MINTPGVQFPVSKYGNTTKNKEEKMQCSTYFPPAPVKLSACFSGKAELVLLPLAAAALTFVVLPSVCQVSSQL